MKKAGLIHDVELESVGIINLKQFLDPLVVGRAFQGRINDPIGYVIAAHTLRRPYLGDLARLFDPIPVERPQDNASKVSMKITVQGDRVVAEDKNSEQNSSLASVVTVIVGGPAGGK